MSSLARPRDVTAKNVDVIASRDIQKYTLASYGIKAEWSLGHKPTTSRLVGILTLLFRGMIFERAMEKGRRKRAGGKVKSAGRVAPFLY